MSTSLMSEATPSISLFTEKEKAFIRIVGRATGLGGIEKYVLAMRETDYDYTQLENGCTFNDHELVFWEAYQLGVNRTLGEAHVN